LKKILDNVLTVILVIVLILMSALSLMLIVSSANDGVASVFGYSPIVLYDTKSMEPTFGAQDLIIVKKQDASELEAGEIISFWGFVDGQRSIITHRIHEVLVLNDGSYAYQTKGDNNELVDQDPMNTYRQMDIYPEDIIGVYVTHISGFGSVLNFVKSPTGVLVCLVIPIALVFLWQLYRVIRLAMAYHREQQAEKNAEMSEAEKQKIIEEYLRKQQESVENPPTEE
jgi:signal peptidase